MKFPQVIRHPSEQIARAAATLLEQVVNDSPERQLLAIRYDALTALKGLQQRLAQKPGHPCCE